jgi:nitroimidazol reductase NimA-like FMN-containing flavoprotein (pyridoxamine 5'-phosphate oxidase superfamily)
MFDAAGLEILERDECMRLAATGSIGRVVFTEQALPAITPVSYALKDGSIFLRASEGSKLANATNGSVVAFEVDEFDTDFRQGWSVVFVGKAMPVSEEGRLEELSGLPLRGWDAQNSHRLIEVKIELVNGRRLPNGWSP